MVVLILAGLALAAYAEKSDTPSKSKPAKVEPVQGTNLKRLTLSTRAAERLGITTAPVREVQVARKSVVVGEVVSAPDAALSGAWVRVPLSGDTLHKGAQGQLVRVLSRDGSGAGVTARAVAWGDPPLLYSVVDSAAPGLLPGQRVRVELTGSETLRKVVPYAAVVYDAHGASWVYTNPTPLTFVRHPISVDYIEGDLAMLSDGPSPGTMVVTSGVAELFGTEFEVGH